jgi:excisionase family DNA binding protein
MIDEPQLLTISTAAKRLGISQGTLRIYADKGIIPVITLPRGHRRFRPEDVERLRKEWGIDAANSEKEQDV